MENYDNILRQQVGHGGRFTVPEGYFEALASRVMARVEADKTEALQIVKASPILKALRRYAAVAACGAIAIVSVMGLTNRPQEDAAQASSSAQQVSVSAVDYAADCMMLDNEDIYAMLSETDHGV